MRRARQASDGRLVLDVVIGLALLLATLLWEPAWWLPLVSGALCFVFFGLWGITDRVLRERGTASGTVPHALRLARGVVTALGALATIAFLLSLAGLMLGTWIS
ncbi:MAG: hypothetical protein ACR2OG_02405 [Gemmatimonadaceae bacterium]